MKDHYRSYPLWPNTPSDPDIRSVVLKELKRFLSKDERNVVKLRWFDEKTWVVIEIKTGFSRQWCKKLEHKAFEKLKKSNSLKEYIERIYSRGVDIDEFQEIKEGL